MGHAVEALAAKKGHEVVWRVDNDAEWAEVIGEWQKQKPDVAVEFSQPAVAEANVRRCLEAGVPVVCGTTGWYAAYDAVCAFCSRRGGKMLTATNFSVGMNIMFALNERLATLMRGRSEYSVDLLEVHHIHKLDAPSGTAITLRGQIVESGERREESIPIESVREGEVPGTHTVTYRSAIDTISLTHEAHSREGLAAGALLAAEWLVGAAPGVYTMKDVLAV